MTDVELGDLLRQEGRELDVTVGELLENDERTRTELADAHYRSLGHDVVLDLRSLYSTLDMVNKNFKEYYHIKQKFLNSEVLSTPSIDNHGEVRGLMNEYARRFHNYAASVHTLKSHSYTFLDRYEEEKPKLKQRYFDEIESRGVAEMVDFVEKLRHYIQKRWQPPLQASTRFDNEGNITKKVLVIKRDELLEWNGWNDSREHVESLDKKIDITDLAEDYQDEINNFYDWFRTIVVQEFYDEIVDWFTAGIQLTEGHRT